LYKLLNGDQKISYRIERDQQKIRGH